jgi:hypothetical protein
MISKKQESPGGSSDPRKKSHTQNTQHDVSELAGNEGGAHMLSDDKDDDQGKKDDPVPNETVSADDDDDIGTGKAADDGVGRSDLNPLREAEHDVAKYVRV